MLKYKVSLGINKTEIMKKEIDAEYMIKSLGLEKKPKLTLYGVVKSVFTDLKIEVKRFYWNRFLSESEHRFKDKPKTLEVAKRLHRYKMYLLMK